jgi:hypothetical protein
MRRERLVTLAPGPAAHDHHVLDEIEALDRFVRRTLERDHLSTAVRSVARYQQLRVGVLDAVAQRFRREAAEHYGMRRPDPGTCEHRDRGFRNHAQLLQGVGELTDLPVQLPVRVHASVARLALPDESGLVGSPPIQVTIEAVVRDVELAADEPAGERRLPLEYRVPLPEPVELLGPGRPEGLAIRSCLPVGGVISHRR